MIKIKQIWLVMVAAACVSCATNSTDSGRDWIGTTAEILKTFDGMGQNAQGIGSKEIAAGLKEALRVGTGTVVTQLGTTNGFNSDPAIHIPLPDELKKVKAQLDKFGMGFMLEDLETRLNRAAESATPKAKSLFLNAISEMTLDDAMGIYNGQDDAATQYFRQKMSVPLAKEFRPIVTNSLNQVAAIKSYDDVMEKYRALPFVPDLHADLGDFVIDKSMDGIFHYLAKEEAAIRANPAKRTTELLRRVFGSSIP